MRPHSSDIQWPESPACLLCQVLELGSQHYLWLAPCRLLLVLLLRLPLLLLLRHQKLLRDLVAWCRQAPLPPLPAQIRLVHQKHELLPLLALPTVFAFCEWSPPQCGELASQADLATSLHNLLTVCWRALAPDL